LAEVESVTDDLFDAVDRNHDGRISRSEFRDAIMGGIIAGRVEAVAESCGSFHRFSSGEGVLHLMEGVEEEEATALRREAELRHRREESRAFERRWWCALAEVVVADSDTKKLGGSPPTRSTLLEPHPPTTPPPRPQRRLLFGSGESAGGGAVAHQRRRRRCQDVSGGTVAAAGSGNPCSSSSSVSATAALNHSSPPGSSCPAATGAATAGAVGFRQPIADDGACGHALRLVASSGGPAAWPPEANGSWTTPPSGLMASASSRGGGLEASRHDLRADFARVPVTELEDSSDSEEGSAMAFCYAAAATAQDDSWLSATRSPWLSATRRQLSM